MNWHSILFLLMAIVTCGFAVAVVLAADMVRMAACLVASLSAVAGLFFLAGANFVGSMQLMIYVGGTLVLLVFGVMLTARGPSVAAMRSGRGHWILAVIVGASLLAVLLQPTLSVKDWNHPPVSPMKNTSSTTSLGMGLLGVRVDQSEQKDLILRQGMCGYLFPFEIISVHLVVVLIGAAYLARARHRKLKTEN